MNQRPKILSKTPIKVESKTMNEVLKPGKGGTNETKRKIFG
jgi:hypothetical protein